MVMDDREKERFRQLMRRAAAFSGVNVLTYAVLDNHFHILLHLPESRPVDDRELVRRLPPCWRSLPRDDKPCLSGTVAQDRQIRRFQLS